ncbi:hypothetical protein acsn021_08060 [Anaerocolumna cellulosilytica]|uniref:Uncharacterized protein n=1 Tax=Anaerocolumna cellulosilytica TaxID=433286 RepID=A0A6S6QZF0_9FIRM|nr:hypothetical protein [Anaerocolumna cellulosilytica]BCJ93237.1 hypothetical protein acsn021_08060 [Anaerocolumna cellulosilytica]
MLTGSLALALLCVAVVVIGGTAAVAVEAKHHFIGNALLDMKDSIVLLFKLGKAVVSPLMEELTEDIHRGTKKVSLKNLTKGFTRYSRYDIINNRSNS